MVRGWIDRCWFGFSTLLTTSILLLPCSHQSLRSCKEEAGCLATGRHVEEEEDGGMGHGHYFAVQRCSCYKSTGWGIRYGDSSLSPTHGELSGGAFRVDYDPKLHITAREVKRREEVPLIIVTVTLSFMCVFALTK
ncbi:hypothetical protein MUK42_33007 [Musa troglodytarum]|uniref:Secreted protein n=1 Tax=Musa troglodytarum TaxID=320322 RepID=A0A9E7JTM3_9LILI|nr:hypothetical protein MUK42_33007 [Musa troglodytarum]